MRKVFDEQLYNILCCEGKGCKDAQTDVSEIEKTCKGETFIPFLHDSFGRFQRLMAPVIQDVVRDSRIQS